ncbi:zinc-ribbon domain-containing protein [Reinekea sp.]|uniref:YfgJ family double zinc ribbon protein n=1 Tax=Reinekea sp. TaxID=1970455 RepID=UPI003989CCA2
MTPKCPDCLNEVEILKACGSTDLFCNHCNQLVSKRKAIIDGQVVAPSPEHQPSIKVTGH